MSRKKRIGALLLSIVMLASVFVACMNQARADEVDAVLSNVTFTENGEYVTIDVDWAIPNDPRASAGDTFTIPLPEELDSSWNGDVEMKTPDGQLVATAKLVDNAWLITLGEYVETHDNVKGHISFNATPKQTLTEGEEVETEITIGTVTKLVVFKKSELEPGALYINKYNNYKYSSPGSTATNNSTMMKLDSVKFNYG